MEERSDPPAAAVTDAILDALTDLDRVEAALYAMRLRLLDELADPTVDDGPLFRATEAEIALATRSSERRVHTLFGEAHALLRQLPRTFESLQRSEITVLQAKILARELCVIDDDAERAEFEARALKEIHRPAGALARVVRRMVDRRHPGSAASRHRLAKERQNVWASAAGDGMAYLTAFLPAPEASAICDRIDDLARLVTAADPDASLGSARVDVLTSILLDKRPGWPRLGAVKTTTVITMPATTLLGGDAMGEIEGFGSIDSETARHLAADSTVFRRMLTDPHTGIRLELGREQYRPTADQRMWLRLRDRRCRFPDCGRRVAASDLDHTTDWQHGGTTETSNLAHLCRRHHTVKHRTPWRVRTGPDGTLHWTSPAGRRYRSPIPTDPDPPWVAELPLGTHRERQA